MKPVLSVGMMSGTSVDGAVDTAAILTDGDSFVERKLISSYCYEKADGLRPIHHCTKAAEIAYRKANGVASEAEKLYPAALNEYVRQTFKLSNPDEIKNKIAQLSAAFTDDDGGQVTLKTVIQKSTEVHLQAAKKIISELGNASEISFIGYHGQTLYHAPFDHITIQVGDAQMLANELGIPVVFDFRGNDIKHGGQGAPLAPVYHRALLRKADLPSAAILNLGGTANITIVSSTTDQIIGFDTGPANGLIDKYVKERAGLGLDKNSRFALAGSVSENALSILLKKAITLADGRNYLEIPPPKSLDIRDYNYDFPEFTQLNLEDGCATLNAFSAQCIAQNLHWLKDFGFSIPENWILCGGGALSPHLSSEIKKRVETKIKKTIKLIPAEDVGWSAQAMEAELFAFLAVRSSRNLPLTFPGTTGVKTPHPGGEIFHPKTTKQSRH